MKTNWEGLHHRLGLTWGKSYIILPDTVICWTASPVSRAWTICIPTPLIRESFVRLDRSRRSGRAKARPTRTTSTADFSRVPATWPWRPFRIASDGKALSRHGIHRNVRSYLFGQDLYQTYRKKTTFRQHCGRCSQDFNPTWNGDGERHKWISTTIALRYKCTMTRPKKEKMDSHPTPNRSSRNERNRNNVLLSYRRPDASKPASRWLVELWLSVRRGTRRAGIPHALDSHTENNLWYF